MSSIIQRRPVDERQDRRSALRYALSPKWGQFCVVTDIFGDRRVTHQGDDLQTAVRVALEDARFDPEDTPALYRLDGRKWVRIPLEIAPVQLSA